MRITRPLALAVSLALVWASFASAAVWTDQDDYAPGSVVTISGDNSNDAGYLTGETVHVDVSGPNDWTATCDGVADDAGAWSCQVTLFDGPEAVGEYSYTATGLASGTSENGNFTDGGFFLRAMVGATPIAVTFPTGTSTTSTLQRFAAPNNTCSGTPSGWQGLITTSTNLAVNNAFVNLTSLGTTLGGSNKLIAPATVVVSGTTYAFSSWAVVSNGPNPVHGSVSQTGTTGCFSGWATPTLAATHVQANYVLADSTAPTVNVSFGTPDGDNDWFTTSPVAGSVSATDSSNVTAISCSGATMGAPTGYGTTSASASLSVATEGTNNVSCTATDGAGNTGAAAGSSNTATVKLDSVAPSVSLVGGPEDGASYILGSVPAAPTCSASDATSLLVGPCTVSGYSTALGTHTVTASAEDNAGNTNSDSATYSVVYAFTGFFRPVDNPDTFNVVKAGQAIPVKFSLGGDQGLDIFAAGSPTSIGIVCDISSDTDAIEQTVTAGGSSLSYDATTDTYTYVWKTNKAWANSCRELTVELEDGTEHTALFKFRR